jgi:branched-chain amino acid transport system permease protein
VHEFLQFTLLGVVTGGIYALTASGIVVTYATTGVLNFAYGSQGMLAAFVYWQVTQAEHWPPLAGIALVLVVLAPLLALVGYALTARSKGGFERTGQAVATLGVLLLLLGLATKLWPTGTARTLPLFFSGRFFRVLGLGVSAHQLVVLGTAAAVALGLFLGVKHTRVGIAARAVVDDRSLAEASGIHAGRVAFASWLVGAELAALAGVLIAPLTTLDPTTLTLIVVNGFAAAAIGRLRSLPGAFLGGIVIGIVEEYAIGYVPGGWSQAWLPNPVLAFPMAFLIIALVSSPAERLAAYGAMSGSLAPRAASRHLAAGTALFALALAVGAGGALPAQLVTVLSQGLALSVVALSLVVVSGYLGLLSLGQLTFAGVGAFVASRIAHGTSLLGLLAAAAAAGVLGVLVALPTVRLRGVYFALATFAFGELADSVFFGNYRLFDVSGSVVLGRLRLFGATTRSSHAELVVLTVAAAVVALIVVELRRSRFGLRILQVADSPTAAALCGTNVRITRAAVVGLAAGLAGLGGALYGGLQGPVSDADFNVISSLVLALIVVVLGRRSVAAGLLAGLVDAALQSHAASAIGLVVGVGALALGRLPEGLVPAALLMARRALSGRLGAGAIARLEAAGKQVGAA